MQMRVRAVCLVGAVVFVVGAAPPAGAGERGSIPVHASAACSAGEHVITYTVTNRLHQPGYPDMVVTNFHLITDPSGPTLTIGAFQPQPMPPDTTAQADVRLDGSFTGEVRGTISVSIVGSSIGGTTHTPDVTLTDPCPPPGAIPSDVTSTTTPSTTTDPAAGVVTRPRLTG